MPDQTAPQPQAAQPYFHALEGLRGLAAIAVALFHWLLSFAGFLAVDFFLALSGFILAHRYLYGAQETSTGGFVLTRIARLYPMHLFGLFSYALVYTWLAGIYPRYPDGTLFTFLQQLTLTQNIGLNQLGLTWNLPSWSVSVEFWLNLAFFCFISRRSKSLALLLSSLVGLAIIHSQTGHLNTSFQNYFQVINSGLLRGWSSFALGLLAYRAYRQARHIAWPAWLLSGAEVLISLIVLGLFFGRGDTLHHLDILSPFVFAAMVLIFALEGGVLSRAVARLNGLGRMSYSIYLNQLVVLMLVDTGLAHLGYSHGQLVPVYLGVLLAYSALTYRWIEVPAKRGLLQLVRNLPRRTPVQHSGT